MRLLLALSAILIMAVSCKKSTESDGFTIRENRCKYVLVGGQEVKICFDDLLEESRCPANANCVWQGVAKARFTLTANGTNSTFDLATLTMPPHYQNEVVELGYKIRLITINPYPGTGPASTSAALEITQ